MDFVAQHCHPYISTSITKYNTSTLYLNTTEIKSINSPSSVFPFFQLQPSLSHKAITWAMSQTT